MYAEGEGWGTATTLLTRLRAINQELSNTEDGLKDAGHAGWVMLDVDMNANSNSRSKEPVENAAAESHLAAP